MPDPVEPWIANGSFKFGSVDMYTAFGLQLMGDSMDEDLFLPEIRTRKITIPLRHGEYDYGAKYYKERPLRLNCVSLQCGNTEGEYRAFAREIAYVLSKKDRIRRWYEPDVYYVGRVEREITLTQLRDVGNVFTLDFTCEPFAYGETLTKGFTNRCLMPEYTGTAETPTYIQIVNIGSSNAATIRISQVDRKDVY